MARTELAVPPVQISLGAKGGESVATALPEVSGATPLASCSKAAGILRDRFRRGCFAPSCRWSQRRNVSWPISVPMSRRPPTRDSTDSPAWRNRSNSSRWTSSFAVARLRGQRTWATASVKLKGRMGGNAVVVGSDMEAIGQYCSWWMGGARGADGEWSKRQRLDVGVLPYCFVLVLRDQVSHRWCSFVDGWSELAVRLGAEIHFMVREWWPASLDGVGEMASWIGSLGVCQDRLPIERSVIPGGLEC
jgi:hypothetical protein